VAEPVRKAAKHWAPEREISEDAEESSVLQRWIELPDGRLDLLEVPLTPELYLDPELDDIMVQGEWHSLTGVEISVLLRHYFRHQPDVRVLFDMKHFLGNGLPAPAPDVSVIRGIRDPLPLDSVDCEKEGVRPCLIVEVVSPKSARIRQTDLVGKVALYERAGVQEYFIVDTSTRKRARRQYTLLGYRLSSTGRYRPIEPDAQGGLLSETTGILFQIAPAGDRLFLFEAATGRRLLNLEEQEERVDREIKARQAAEAETARLREEIERLRGNR
jgi:Uma2 family endonuclease